MTATKIDAIIAELPAAQRGLMLTWWGSGVKEPGLVTVRWGGQMSKALENLLRLDLVSEVAPNRWGHHYDITPLGKDVVRALEEHAPVAEVMEED